MTSNVWLETTVPIFSPCCSLCAYDPSTRTPSNVTISFSSTLIFRCADDMVALSNGFFYPSFRRALFLCRPCVERVQATGEILARWKGKLDVVFPRNLQPCWDKSSSNNNGGCGNNGSNNYCSTNDGNIPVRSGDDSMYVQGMIERTPSVCTIAQPFNRSKRRCDGRCVKTNAE